MTAAARAARRDAGKPRITPRDSAALTFLAEMYGAPLDLIDRLLGGISRSRTYATVQRWERGGWVQRGAVDAGPAWVWPTRQTATAYLGWDPGAWRPRPTMSAHLRAVAAVRIAWDAIAGDRWISERRLQHGTGMRKSGETVAHMHDGVWIAPDGAEWAVEVELTPKGPQRTFEAVRAAGGAAAQQHRQLVYVCTPEAAPGVVEAIQRLEEITGRSVRTILHRSIEEVPLWRVSNG